MPTLNLIDDYDPTERSDVASELSISERESLGWDNPDAIDAEDFDQQFDGWDTDPED